MAYEFIPTALNYICRERVINPAKHRFAAMGLTTLSRQILYSQAGMNQWLPKGQPDAG